MIQTQKIENLSDYIATYSPFLPIILFFLFYQVTKKQKSLWPIIVFAILTIANFFLEDYIPKKIVYRKIFLGFTTFYEYALFTIFLWNNIKNRLFKNVIVVLSISFVCFLIFYYTSARFKRLDSVPIGIECILILIYSFYFFYEKINNPDVLFIYNDYKFWITTGIMIYLSGSFFIYIFANQVPKNELNLYWSFSFIFMGIMNILFSIGILILGLQPKKHHPKPKANHHYLDIT